MILRHLVALRMLVVVLGTLLIILFLRISAVAQDTLSAQVLRLLARANAWTAVQTFTVDPQFSATHTTAPDGTACDSTGELGKWYFDSAADNVYICSGASGWRKITTAVP